MRKIYIVLVVLAIGIDAKVLKLDDFIATAMRNSPDIKIAYYDIVGARDDTIVAKSLRLPQINLSISSTRVNDRFRGGIFKQSDTLLGTIGVSQLIYDFGRSSANIKSAIEAHQASIEQFKQIVSDKILEVKIRYYDALKAKTLIRVYQKSLSLQKKHLYSAKKYLKAGIKTVVDVTDAQIKVAQAKKMLNDAKYLLKYKKTLLQESIGTTPYGGKYTLYMPIKEFGDLKLPKYREDLKSLIDIAIKNRAILKAMEHRVLSTQALADSKSATKYPYIDLVAEVGAKDVDAKDTLLPTRHEKISIRANWDIFTGYRQKAQIEKARVEEIKSHYKLDRVKLSIKKEVTQSYLNLKHKEDNFNLNRLILKQAKKRYIQVKKRYINNLANYIELQDAHQIYIESLASLVNSYYEYFIAKANLEHSIGR